MSTIRLVAILVSSVSVAWVFGAQTDTVVINSTVSPILCVRASGTPSGLVLQAPATGGAVPAGGTDSSTYLWYTSTVATAGTHRITAALGAPLPSGVRLRLLATAPAGNSAGVVGTPSATLNLSTTPQNLITGIGACYTGTSAGDGARLNYQLEVANWASYKAFSAASVTVTFTMRD